HVFISYVRENEADVQRIYDNLTQEGIEVWLDRKNIKPGFRWKDAIREAIKEGVFFIACFSAEYSARTKSYMNEELTIAIEELRKIPTNRSWFIPVLLSDCEIPDRTIGAGETLRDIQFVPLYRDWDVGIHDIINVIR
ncbi:MAG: toll/interleukin-1 receptor domain-containing protein, partial [Candidatus Hodarchaeota archaeon]